jgi:hypothetical protein
MLPLLLLYLLGLDVRGIMGLPQSMVASSPLPLNQAFPSDYYDISGTTEVGVHYTTFT